MNAMQTKNEMMEQFKGKVVAIVQRNMGEQYRVEGHVTQKNNGVTYHSITILKNGTNISPNIRVDEYFMSYQKGEMTLNEVSEEIETCYEAYKKEKMFDVTCFTEFKKAKQHIMFRIVNQKTNHERLKRMPHRELLDLAVTYYYLMDTQMCSGTRGSIQIENDHMNQWDVTESELFEIAMENTIRELPLEKKNMGELLYQMLMNRCMGDEEELEKLLKEQDQLMPMYVISNSMDYYGAAVLLYPNALRNIAKSCEADLIVIPSSVHELIILPVRGDEDYDKVNTMISEVNEDHVATDEILSDHFYYYNLKNGELSILETQDIAI